MDGRKSLYNTASANLSLTISLVTPMLNLKQKIRD